MAGGIDLFDIQESIKEYIADSFPLINVDSGAVPTAESLPFVDGILEPYIIVRFSDMMPPSGGQTFGGPVYDEYYSYVDALCVGPTDTDARQLASFVNSFMLGKDFYNAGTIKKNFGGGQFAIAAEAGRQPIAFIAVASFRFPVNVSDIGAGSRL